MHRPAVPASPLAPADGEINPWLVLLLAVSCGLVVANIYYAQPLVGPISLALGMPAQAAGLIVTLTQIGYGLGLLFVIPLAVLRNGFRIFTVGEMCVNFGPQMINHWIHRKGGPIFFGLSLVPLFLLLLALYRFENRQRGADLKPPLV